LAHNSFVHMHAWAVAPMKTQDKGTRKNTASQTD